MTFYKKQASAFTLIELLVVIAIISIIAVLGMVALSNARANSRDAKRVADVKQVQVALDMFYDSNNRYPTEDEWTGGSIVGTSSSGETIYYLTSIPEAPLPPDGTCSTNDNSYTYTTTGDSYTLNFCVGSKIKSLENKMSGGGLVVATEKGLDYLGEGSGDNIIPQITTFALSYGSSVWSEHLGSVAQTSDGGYVLAGFTQISGVNKTYVAKTNAAGTALWSYDYLPSISGLIVQQMSDGNYIIAGSTVPPNQEAYLMKLNSSGTKSWEKTFALANDQIINSFIIDTDNNFILAGSDEVVNDGDMYILKTDSSGNEIWSYNYGGAGYQRANKIKQTSDGGYIIAGTNYNSGGGDFNLIKINSSGVQTWNYNYGGAGLQSGVSVQQTSDGGYIVAGTDGSTGEALLLKVNSAGVLSWTQAHGGVGDATNYFSDVYQTSDGGYIVAGYAEVGEGIYLVKTNSVGALTWSRIYSNTFSASYVRQLGDGGYIIGGNKYNASVDFHLMKTDDLGVVN